MMHSNTNVLSNAGTFDSFDMFGLSNRASAQQQKHADDPSRKMTKEFLEEADKNAAVRVAASEN